MKVMLNCRQATRWVLEGQDRRLSTSERLRLRLHMFICQACPRFAQQAQLMHRAMGRWQAYAENEAPATKPDADRPPR